ncbi:dTDP-4-dehydrorhamnose reductase, partial [Alistipes sp. OttesenSCG-928-L06]|nr:dTDP-4-dehydrorhamnose reductase [Alistipes sp. OttesenSCG-928-L06]
MRIGVTGANGQLGCSLRKIADDYPAHTFVFSDLPETDITDKAGIEAWAVANQLEIIVNCAAYTAVDRAESEPDAAWRVNALGPAVLAEVCAEKGIRLIHLSTDYVFDGTAETPYREDDTTHPLGVYGSTKLQGEQAIRESGCDALIVRTSWLYSEFGHNFVKTMLRLGAERAEVRVVDDQTGCPTYATNLARAIIQLTNKGFSGFGVYHYCDDGTTTWYDFARQIFAVAENPVPVIPIETKDYPTPAKRPKYSVLSTNKIKTAGIQTPYWVDTLQ